MNIESVALYARVSTANSHQDPEVQLRALREYCQLRGWKIVQEYVDKGVSGTKASRPELDAMMSVVPGGGFDAVVVWKFDRFARSTPHLLEALTIFKTNHVAFVSMTEAIDTSTPMGEFVLTILGAVAKLERSLIIERVKAGQRHAKAKGKHIGRSFGPRAHFDLESARRRHRSGENLRSIADSMGVSHALIWKRLRTA